MFFVFCFSLLGHSSATTTQNEVHTKVMWSTPRHQINEMRISPSTIKTCVTKEGLQIDKCVDLNTVLLRFIKKMDDFL